jgi:hypothetical protein
MQSKTQHVQVQRYHHHHAAHYFLAPSASTIFFLQGTRAVQIGIGMSITRVAGSNSSGLFT